MGGHNSSSLTSYKDIDFDEVQEHLKFLADSIWHDITVSDFKLKVLYTETLNKKTYRCV
jgi:hypothetical protein